uniref:CTCHY-type domain-containing protein n=1 Tax=Strigamia maritima TaxID=126957 RepID=T1IIY1_STRMM
MSYGVDVIIKDVSSHPKCPHGSPTLLFERYTEKKTGSQKYFACSANRERKFCPFFQLADVNKKYVSNKRVNPDTIDVQLIKSHEKIYSGFKKLKKLNQSDRSYCHDCSCFVLSSELKNHKGHNIVNSLSAEVLSKPTNLLKPLTNSGSEAQFLFTAKVVQFLINTTKNLNFTHVLCVGCPRIHEFIVNHPETKLNSLLLDIDARYEHFYGSTQFCHYNLFNHYFFRGDNSKDVYRNFMKCTGDDKILIMLDPPFGGLTDVIAYTLKLISKDWFLVNGKTNTSHIISTFLIFPYFMERRIIDTLSFSMLDYQVDYENHPLFKKGNQASKRLSPVRIFTNISPASIPLPLEENYRFCEICQRHVSSENKHCTICNACTSKDGYPFIHCHMCNCCFKSTKRHCNICERCLPTDHTCGLQSSQGCHKCGDISHKRRQCPLQSDVIQSAKRKKIKK